MFLTTSKSIKNYLFEDIMIRLRKIIIIFLAVALSHKMFGQTLNFIHADFQNV
jgi:hypothetical protein